MPVYSTHRTYPDAKVQWDRCRDALAGTDAVKKAGIKYLPLLEGQAAAREAPYIGYVMRALFYPAIARTVAGLAGLAFGKPPSVDGVQKIYQTEFEDVTLTGLSLGAYGMSMCQEALITGRVGTLLDMPEEPSLDARPYWVIYPAEHILNWKVERIAGKQMLTMVVLLEEKEEIDPKDEFMPIPVRQYRVLRLIDGMYTVNVWTEKKDNAGKTKAGDWAEGPTRIPLRRGVALTYIPFVILGATGVDYAIDHPPLLDLVDVNLSHYRTSADQEHGAHFTALPTPFVTGHSLNPGEQLAIGSGVAWVLPNAQATAGMVEFSGAGLKSLADIKEEKRQLMATLGARMLETQKNVQESAQAIGMRHAGERSGLSILADCVGQALTIAMRWHLYWSGVEESAAKKALVRLNPDIMDQLTPEDMNALVSAWQAGAISQKTVYFNLEWGEWTRPGVEFDEELSDIEDEIPEPPDEKLPLGKRMEYDDQGRVIRIVPDDGQAVKGAA